MAKNLVINCATCDIRKVTEEKLMAYEGITINAALIISSVESRAIMDQYLVTMNCASVLDIEGDVQVSTVNGRAEIKSTDVPTGGKRFLLVNGSAEIGAGTEKVLQQYAGIQVNGSVSYPESMGAHLGMLKVNGSAICYPDGAIVLKRSAVIDRTFVLRAKKNLYWAEKRLIMVDPALNMEVLKQKGASFSTQEAIIAESKVEAAVELLDEKTQIIVVPDGTAVITDDVALNDVAVKKYGTKMYVLGDANAQQDAAAAIAALEYLVICGDASVHMDLKDLLLEKANDISGNVQVIKNSRVLSDKPDVRISAWMLEREADGILVKDCVTVRIDPDISKELIAEKLSIADCASVVCTQEQEDAVGSICQDVADIGPEGGGMDIGKLVKEAMTGSTINCSEYVM